MNGETPQDGKAQCAAFIPHWLQYVPAPPDRGKNKYDVFISYRSSDRGWALALYDVLKLAGWAPFLDQFYLVAGQSLSVSLEEAMASSSSGIIIWSSNTKDSDWCRREREAMISLKDDTGKFSYVFAQLDKEPLPLFARSDLYVSFEQGTERPDGINLLKLICGLKGVPLPEDAVRMAQQALETEQTILKQISGAQHAGAVHRVRKLGTSEPLQSPRPAFEAARGLMCMGAYNDALFVLENAEAHFPKSIDIRRLKGSVLRRLEQFQDAINILSEVYAEGHADSETLSELASLWSGRYDASGIILYLRRSRNLYQQAFELDPEDIYSGINAAVKSLFLGEEDVANQIAETAIIQLEQHKSYPDPYRSLIVAQAHLMKRNLEDSRRLYQKMVDDFFDEYKGQLFATYKQVMKICKALRMSEDETRYILHPFQLLKDLK